MTTIQEAKQYLVHRIRQLSEEILPGWYLEIAFVTKGLKSGISVVKEPRTFMYIDPMYTRRAVRKGYKAYRLVINENVIRDNRENIRALDIEHTLVHELEHVPDVFEQVLVHIKRTANYKITRNLAVRKKISLDEFKQKSSAIIKEMKNQPEYHSIPRYREAVKQRTGSIIPALPGNPRASEMSFVGKGMAIGPSMARYMYRCPFCGHLGSYTPEHLKPVTRKTAAGGRTMHLPRIGEGVRCEGCGRFLPADTRTIKLSPRERTELLALARAHDALPYENLAQKGLPYNYPLYKEAREIPLERIPTTKLMKVIPRVKKLL